MPKLESAFQRIVIDEIKRRLPGCEVLKQDSASRQGIPDLLILYRGRWAMLENKRESNSARQANQEYYIDMFDTMSFAAFICPDTKDRVLDEMEHTLTS